MNLKSILKILSYSNFGNLFSFLYLIFISNYLLTNDFSLITSITTLAIGIAYIFSFFVPVISNIVSKNKKKNIWGFYINSTKILFYLFILSFLFIFLTKEIFYIFFKFQDLKILFFFPIIIFSNILLYIQIGLLSGLSLFKFQSKIISIQQFLKLTLMIILLLFLYNNLFPLIATTISMIVTILIFHKKIHQYLNKDKNLKKNKNQKILNSTQILKAIIITITSAVLIYSDIVISRYVFDYNISSEFNIMSSLSKINYYFLFALIPTIIPIINLTKNSKDKNKYIKKIFIILFSTLCITNLIYYNFSEVIFNSVFNMNISNIQNMIKINTSSIIYTGSIILLYISYTARHNKTLYFLSLLMIIYLYILFQQTNMILFIDIILYLNILFFLVLLLKYLFLKSLVKFNQNFIKIFF
jgi:hypothetical protein